MVVRDILLQLLLALALMGQGLRGNVVVLLRSQMGHRLQAVGSLDERCALLDDLGSCCMLQKAACLMVLHDSIVRSLLQQTRVLLMHRSGDCRRLLMLRQAVSTRTALDDTPVLATVQVVCTTRR